MDVWSGVMNSTCDANREECLDSEFVFLIDFIIKVNRITRINWITQVLGKK